jgi:hypothetical protein
MTPGPRIITTGKYVVVFWIVTPCSAMVGYLAACGTGTGIGSIAADSPFWPLLHLLGTVGTDKKKLFVFDGGGVGGIG